MPVQVREATPDDGVRLAEFGARAFADTFAADNTPQNMARYLRATFGPEHQARELADPGLLYLLAEEGGVLVGSARLGFGPAPAVIPARRPVEVARFYAAQAHIGRGIGRALMEHCLDTARRRERDVMWLGVWEKNTRAIEFYARWGFETAGTIVFQLGDDAQTDWLMARGVAAP